MADGKDKDIMEYVMQLARMSHRSSGKKEDGHVPRGVLRAMRVLSEQETMRSSILAHRLDIRTGSMSEMLAKMEHAGLIHREKDARDFRIVNVSLTEKGRRELEAGKQRFIERREKLNHIITDEERGQFTGICEKLIAFFEFEAEAGEEYRRRGRHVNDEQRGKYRGEYGRYGGGRERGE